MTAVMRRGEKGPRRTRRTSPERKPAARDTRVELRPDLKPVVAVALVIREQRRDLVPHGAPGRRTDEIQTGGETGRIAERKVEPGQHAVAATHGVGQQFAQQLRRRMARPRVFQQQFSPAAADGADPDAVAPGLRRAGSAPVDNHELIEQRPASSSSLVMIGMTMPVGMRMSVIVPGDAIGDVPVDMIVAMTYPGTADVMMMPLLQRTDGVVVPDNARAVFAKLAVHRRSAGFRIRRCDRERPR